MNYAARSVVMWNWLLEHYLAQRRLLPDRYYRAMLNLAFIGLPRSPIHGIQSSALYAKYFRTF